MYILFVLISGVGEGHSAVRFALEGPPVLGLCSTAVAGVGVRRQMHLLFDCGTIPTLLQTTLGTRFKCETVLLTHVGHFWFGVARGVADATRRDGLGKVVFKAADVLLERHIIGTWVEGVPGQREQFTHAALAITACRCEVLHSHVVKIHAGQKPEPTVTDDLHQSRNTIEVDDRRCQPKDMRVQLLEFPSRTNDPHSQC